MSSADAPSWPASSMRDPAHHHHQQDFAAAESLLQHSRSARNYSAPAMDGFATSMPPGSVNQTAQSYALEPTQAPLMDAMSPVQYQTQFNHPFQPPLPTQEHVPQPFHASLAPALPMSDLQRPYDHHMQTQQAQVHTPVVPTLASQAGQGNGHVRSNEHSANGSESRSPIVQKESKGGNTSWTPQSKDIKGTVKQDMDDKPAWSDLKTKAGKERKRLPLACIACRRKKIRCSGEKPTCKHCQRSRVPCVYKITTRKAAPRTDYMAMLDRRLKRMEDRVIKIIPKDEGEGGPSIPRATLKPTAGNQSASGRKRVAAEAFGPQVDQWALAKSSAHPTKGKKAEESKANTEGAEDLPSPEIREHLSEVFFDCLYGQSYHLLHKPSYMRRLKAGTLPPVLVLAVCATSARFSTHPEVNTEPAFLRGESWAAPARRIVLERYDQPNITTLTVLLLLGLHEFGTCQGGRSWMFAGMASRMAYALQLHRELDHDPLGTRHDKNSELSFTDREIRRRTMWACFLMDRFCASGTERPMFADEDAIKVQLPIKENRFQMDLPGPTESLDGRNPDGAGIDVAHAEEAKANMGVAAYMIRAVALWGRVIKYLNMGGKERDSFRCWDSESGFMALKKEAAAFKSNFPAELENTRENLQNHAAEKLANQFIFLHVAVYQVVLFLHRFAIPLTPGARHASQIPKAFLAEAGHIAIDAATHISLLLNDAIEYNAVAPFISYSAFLSGTVLVWGVFSKNASLEVTCKENLGKNVRYLGNMERYWGMCPFMVKNLKDIYRQHADAALKGPSEAASKESPVFQYGDWFTRYPNGVSRSEFDDPARIKKEPTDDAALSQKSDLQTVEAFFQTMTSPNPAANPTTTTTTSKSLPKKSTRGSKSAKLAAATTTHPPNPSQQQQPHPSPLQMDTTTALPPHPTTFPLPLSLSSPSQQPPLTPFHPTNSNPHLYPTHPASYPSTTDPHTTHLLSLQNPALLPQLDRSLVYDAYNDSPDSSGGAMGTLTDYTTPTTAGGGIWDGTGGAGMDMEMRQREQQMQEQQMPGQQQGMGLGLGLSDGVSGDGAGMGGEYFQNDIQTSAWFMPFNMPPPGMEDTEGLLAGEAWVDTTIWSIALLW